MSEDLKASLDELRRIHSLMKAEKFDVGAFLGLVSGIFGSETTCIMQEQADKDGSRSLHAAYHAPGANGMGDIRLSREDAFSRVLDRGDFVLLGPEPDAGAAEIQGQGIQQCIIGPIDVCEGPRHWILIGNRQKEGRFAPDDVALADVLGYFVSLRCADTRLHSEAQILEMAADFGFNLSLRNLRGQKIDCEFLKRIHNDLLRHDLARRDVENRLQSFKIRNEMEGKYFIRDVQSRTKSFDSILEKMRRTDRPYEAFDDLAGVRVIINYLSDLSKVLDFINTDGGFKVTNTDDRTQQPGFGGYRACHMTVQVLAPHLADKEGKYPLCEIQIRTSYQDSWSVKTHALTYKQERDVPPDLLNLLELLSDHLFIADRQSDTLRRTIEQYVKVHGQSQK